jgi:predicted ferric reductase
MQTHASPRLRGLSGFWLALAYVAALTVPLALAYLYGRSHALAWRDATAATGIVAGVALVLQFVTSGRFEFLSGRIGIDVTMAFHKWSARALVLVVIVHPLTFIVPNVLADPSRTLDWLIYVFFDRRFLTGTVSGVATIVLVLMALYRDRLGHYALWRATHGLLALAAVVFLVLHVLRAGHYARFFPLDALWPMLAIVVVASALAVYGDRALQMAATRWRVVGNRKVADGLWEVTLRHDKGKGLGYRAGQFAWIAFGGRRYPLFDHPFSIASAPAAGNDLSFLIKESGDFTASIGAVPVGTKAGLDAPHGSFVLDETTGGALLLVAGGVGIAPILGILRELAARGDRRPVRLIYAGARPQGMIAPERIVLEAGGLDLKAIFLAEEAAPDWPYGRGRVTPAVVGEMLAGLDRGRVQAMLCGPGGMMCATCDLLRDGGVPLAAIRYERFDYADAARSAKDRRLLAGFAAIGAAVTAAVVAFSLA